VLDELGIDATTLARRVGLAPSTLTRFLNDIDATHILSARTLSKISTYAGTQPPTSLGGLPQMDKNATPTQGGITIAGPVPQSSVRDLPVLGHARAGMEGFFTDNGAIQGYVERPWFLLGRPDSYACYVSDESMYPVYRHGELLYVDPIRPVGRDDDVIIELSDGQAFVKRFVRRTGDEILCKQFNPEKDIAYDARAVKAVHLVVAALRVRT
jgi:phage repressor protein C with HTH and peptisase S24 domain